MELAGQNRTDVDSKRTGGKGSRRGTREQGGRGEKASMAWTGLNFDRYTWEKVTQRPKQRIMERGSECIWRAVGSVLEDPETGLLAAEVHTRRV